MAKDLPRLLAVSAAALVLGASRGWAAFEPGQFKEETSQKEINDFYQQNPEIAKLSKKYKEDAERRKRLGNEDVRERALDATLDEGVQAENARLAAAHPDSYMKDLVAEYLEEKGQMVEENIWSAGEEKATPEVRQLYRDYLRRLYWQGHGTDGDSSKHVALIRGMLEKPRGWQGFPTANMGPQPPGIAATYGGWHVKMGTGVLDICVFSHEMFHWTDDVFGGVDGESRHNHGGPEAHAYAQMCKEL